MTNLRKDYANKLAAFNAKGTWDAAAYAEIKDLEKRVALLPPEPEPQPELKLETEDEKPKKGR